MEQEIVEVSDSSRTALRIPDLNKTGSPITKSPRERAQPSWVRLRGEKMVLIFMSLMRRGAQVPTMKT